MAHPDPNRQGSEKGQREHAGPTSEKSDAGLQTKSQGARGKGPQPADTADTSERPDAAPNDRGDAPAGEQRELEGGGRIASRGLDSTGGTEPRSDGQRPYSPRGSPAHKR